MLVLVALKSWIVASGQDVGVGVGGSAIVM